jgi:hypothetical protein
MKETGEEAMSINDPGAGADPGSSDSSGGTGDGQDQASAEVRTQPQVDDSQASVGQIPTDPAVEVAQFDTSFDGTEVA